MKNSRRNFLKNTLLSGAGLAATGIAGNVLPLSEAVAKDLEIDQPLSLYYEFRVVGIEHKAIVKAVSDLSATLKDQSGFLSLSLKNMVGDSTMAKNYPAKQKGLLASSYMDSFKEHRLPLFFSLFIRFDSSKSLKKAGIDNWFADVIIPHLHAYAMKAGKPVKTPIVMEHYEDIFVTVAAGDRNKIYHSQNDIKQFLKQQKDIPSKGYITVGNHVSIETKNTDAFNEKTKALLSVAQNTFRPDIADNDYSSTADPDKTGQVGTMENHFYRKAVTTEIMQSIHDAAGLRRYIMHGVWQSILDHENSHLDPRFQKAAGPVGASVVIGPNEPFYETRFLANQQEA
jgi:hypothetical protein